MTTTPSNNISGNSVLVGISGGVDSAVTAYLLKQRNFSVTGVYFQITDKIDRIETAESLSEFLEIPLHIIDLKNEFQKSIVKPFIEGYEKALTPNPCIICNPSIKWNNMLKLADKLVKPFVATGHYARIIDSRIYRGSDRKKDQSYFLYRLSSQQLKRTIFPLGDKSKREVRDIAHSINLPGGRSRESHEICFVGKNELRQFMERKARMEISEGKILDTQGNVIGKHSGWTGYTIGQRRGLDVSSSSGRLYILDIDPIANTITLGPREYLMKRTISLKNCIFHGNHKIGETGQFTFQIRHQGKAISGEITRKTKSTASVTLEETVFAPAAGQSVVFYSNDLLEGGGIIS